MAVEVEKLIVTLEARLQGYEANMSRAQGVTNQRLDQMERRFSQFGGSVRGVIGSLGVYLSGRELVGYANAWTRVNRSLSAGEQVFGTRLRSAEDLNKLASDARVDLEAYSKLYIRTAGAIRDYGFEAGTAEKVTSTLAKALKLGGAAASEQASVLLQFSQALNKGKLDGDEFRSVMENANVVQELLAERLKVSKGEIIKLAAEGKLRIKDLVGAMVDGGDKVDRIFRQMPQTIDEAWTVLTNSVTQYVGELDKTYKFTENVSGLIGVLARNIETVGDAALVMAAGMSAAFAPRMVAAVVGMAAATGAMLSPIALIIGALAAAGTAISVFADDIRLGEGGAVTLRDVIEDLTGKLGDTDKALQKLDLGKNVLASLAKEAKYATEEFAQLAQRIDAGARKFDEFAQEPGYDQSRPEDSAPQESITARIAREKKLGGFGSSLGSYLRGEIPEEKRGKPGTDGDTKSFNAEIERVKKRTAALLAEAKAYGESEAVKTRAVTIEQLLSDAQRAGLKVTPERIKAIEAVSEAFAKASAEAAFLSKLQGAKEDAAALERELQLVGLTGAALEKARIEQELFNEAKRLGYALTPEREAEIKAIADRTAELKRQREVMEEVRDVSREAMRGFIDDMVEGKSAAEALAGVLNKIADKLLEFGINQALNAALGGGTGLNLFGFANGGIASHGRPVSLPKFAGGGVARSASIFGEAGPEAAVPLPDGRRIPVDLRMPEPVAAPGRAAASIVVAPVFNVENGTPEGVDKLRNEIVPLIERVARTEVAQQIDRNPVFAPLKRG